MTGQPVGPSTSWGVVVPVKRLALAKSRLSPYGEQARQELALAFACDVVRAATQVAEVLVITDDPLAAAAVAELGALVAPDEPDAGLNPALAHGAELLRATAPECGVATLSADLPALRADDLRAVLAAVEPRTRGFVCDLGGTGTTLLAAGSGASLDPAFGPASAAAHRDTGAVELVAAPGLRCDADTPDDLLTALALGVGPATRAATARLGLTTRQGTVRSWDASGGSAFLDDGRIVTFGPGALQDSGFRFLRLGQRVRLVFVSDEAVRVALP